MQPQAILICFKLLPFLPIKKQPFSLSLYIFLSRSFFLSRFSSLSLCPLCFSVFHPTSLPFPLFCLFIPLDCSLSPPLSPLSCSLFPSIILSPSLSLSLPPSLLLNNLNKVSSFPSTPLYHYPSSSLISSPLSLSLSRPLSFSTTV